MSNPLPSRLRSLLKPSAAADGCPMDGLPQVWDTLGVTRTAGVFEGLYGAYYDAVISRPQLLSPIMRLAFGNERISARTDALVAWLADDLPLDDAGKAIVLDVPCGGGSELLALDEHVGSVVGADLSPAMLKRASERIQVAGSSALLVHGDAQALPFRDGSFHGALSINGLHVMPDPALFVSELRRVLVTGGVLVLTTLVERSGLRHRVTANLLGHRALRVLPQAPLAREGVRELLVDAGFSIREEEGSSIVAFRCVAS